MDDGHVLCEPSKVDEFLRILDEELARVGATRGEGSGVKSIARLVDGESAKYEMGTVWATD